MTILKFINMFILQWFYIRIAKSNFINQKGNTKWYILYWIIPLSGWKNDFEYVNNKENSLKLF